MSMESRKQGYSLIRHVLDDDCQDPDCEVHNITVAIEEEVVSQELVAFWIAGAQAMRDHMLANLEHVRDLAKEFLDEIPSTERLWSDYQRRH